jgi:hypothetical protein
MQPSCVIYLVRYKFLMVLCPTNRYQDDHYMLCWRPDYSLHSFQSLMQLILIRWIDSYKCVSYDIVPFCATSDRKWLELYRTTWCKVHPNHFISLICVWWTLINHCVNWVSSSVFVLAHDCPRNVVFTCLPPIDNRLLCIKENTNIHNNSYFLNYMTTELNFRNILSHIEMNLMYS